MKIEVLFDKNAKDKKLHTGWGVSFLVDGKILFDTGESVLYLMDNLKALSVDVDKDDLMRRLTGRRTCKNCQQMYNIYFSTPKKGVCDKCGGDLYQRDDDKEETIKNRLDIYDAQTAPLIDYYSAKGILKSIDGSGSIDDIFNGICEIVDPLNK